MRFAYDCVLIATDFPPGQSRVPNEPEIYCLHIVVSSTTCGLDAKLASLRAPGQQRQRGENSLQEVGSLPPHLLLLSSWSLGL
jgi:hypothetical protein